MSILGRSIFVALGVFCPVLHSIHAQATGPCEKLLERYGRILSLNNPEDAQFLEAFRKSVKTKTGYDVITDPERLRAVQTAIRERDFVQELSRNGSGIPESILRQIYAEDLARIRSGEDTFAREERTAGFVSRHENVLAVRPQNLNVTVLMHERFHTLQTQRPHWRAVDNWEEARYAGANFDLVNELTPDILRPELTRYFQVAREVETLAYELNMFAYLRRKTGGTVIFLEELSDSVCPKNNKIASMVWGSTGLLDYLLVNLRRMIEGGGDIARLEKTFLALEARASELNQIALQRPLTPIEMRALDLAEGMITVKRIMEMYGFTFPILSELSRAYPYKMDTYVQIMHNYLIPRFQEGAIDPENRIPFILFQDFLPPRELALFQTGIFKPDFSFLNGLSHHFPLAR